MTDRRVYLQPAYILEQQDYRETSLLLEVFTRDFGRFSLLAKGVRKAKSKARGLLRPFLPLRLSFTGKAELKTLIDVEMAQAPQPLAGIALYCGFYLNELIEAFLHRDDPHPELFAAYGRCLAELPLTDRIETVLRNFELDLIEQTGYGLHFGWNRGTDRAVASEKRYILGPDLNLAEAENGPYRGQCLLAMQSRDFSDSDVLAEAKLLLRQIIDQLLHGKPLNSRRVLNEIIKRL